MFSRAELETIAELCRATTPSRVTDEIYEHILYDGAVHVPMATLPGMAARTITINGMSKTYSVTGWRVGWTIAPRPLTGAIRKVHDFLTVGAAAPLQEAGALALDLPACYYEELARAYDRRRAAAARHPRRGGLHRPPAARRLLRDGGDRPAWLGRRRGLRASPRGRGRGGGGSGISSFYRDPRSGRGQVRFAFCKKRRRSPRPRRAWRGSGPRVRLMTAVVFATAILLFAPAKSGPREAERLAAEALRTAERQPAAALEQARRALAVTAEFDPTLTSSPPDARAGGGGRVREPRATSTAATAPGSTTPWASAWPASTPRRGAPVFRSGRAAGRAPASASRVSPASCWPRAGPRPRSTVW